MCVCGVGGGGGGGEGHKHTIFLNKTNVGGGGGAHAPLAPRFLRQCVTLSGELKHIKRLALIETNKVNKKDKPM